MMYNNIYVIYVVYWFIYRRPGMWSYKGGCRTLGGQVFDDLNGVPGVTISALSDPHGLTIMLPLPHS